MKRKEKKKGKGKNREKKIDRRETSTRTGLRVRHAAAYWTPHQTDASTGSCRRVFPRERGKIREPVRTVHPVRPFGPEGFPLFLLSNKKKVAVSRINTNLIHYYILYIITSQSSISFSIYFDGPLFCFWIHRSSEWSRQPPYKNGGSFTLLSIRVFSLSQRVATNAAPIPLGRQLALLPAPPCRVTLPSAGSMTPSARPP
jgi:hypothetical protein